MPFPLIQIIHLCNSVIGIVELGLLIGVSTNIRTFVNNGAAVAGFGNFSTFAYPATYVFMFIPTISAIVYGSILAADSSPNYRAWLPSKTMRGSVIFITIMLFLAAFLPAVPGADVMTDGRALDCNWTDYMAWTTVFNDPITYPWVNNMDKACAILKAADIFCWLLAVGWLVQSSIYISAAHKAKVFLKE